MQITTEKRVRRLHELTQEEAWRLSKAKRARFNPDKLRQARLDAKLAQCDVAETLGVKLDLVREWERGKVPSGATLLRLMLVYGVDVIDLVDL